MQSRRQIIGFIKVRPLLAALVIILQFSILYNVDGKELFICNAKLAKISIEKSS